MTVIKKAILSVLFAFHFIFPTNLSRAQTSGTLDLSFNDDGKTFTTLVTNAPYPGLAYNRSSAVAVNGNRIYVSGWCASNGATPTNGIGVVAYKLDGSLDNTFSGDGKLIIPEGTQGRRAADVITQQDGKILLGGNDDNDFLIIRLNTDGTMDNSWGTNGISTLDITGTWERINKLALQPDGKILAAGYSGTNVNDITITRFNVNGTIDSSFGVNGSINMDLQGRSDRIEGLMVQSDGRILLAGSSHRDVGDLDGFIMRLTPDGELDPTFDSDGYVIIDFGGDEELTGISLLPDGDIIVSGKKLSSTFGIYRFNDGGTLDSSFGVDGFADTGVVGWSLNVEYHNSNKIVMFAYTTGFPSRDLAIVVLDTKGNLDPCFGINGIFKLDLGTNTQDYAYEGVFQNDGHLLLTGDYNAAEQFALIRVIGPSPYFSNGINLNDLTLTATANDVTYQWEDCDLGTPIVEETDQSFTPTRNGNYRVVLTKDGCSIPSACTQVIVSPCSQQEIEMTTSICEGESFLFGTDELTSQGIYSKLFQSVAGCDSTVTLKLNVFPTYDETMVATICEGQQYLLGSELLDQEGAYTRTFQSKQACDSTVVLNLTVLPKYNQSVAATICDGEEYVFGSDLISQGGSYTKTFQSIAGCDSTVTLNLEVLPKYDESVNSVICGDDKFLFGSDLLSTAGFYTKIFKTILGCDSTVHLDLHVVPAINVSLTKTICPGETFSFGSQTLNEEGEYVEVFSSVTGCDSTVVLNLNIPHIETNITQEGFTFASDEHESTYQWINCSEGDSFIAGATERTFSPAQTGDYALVVTKDGCEVTIDCFNVTILNAGEERTQRTHPYPNPVNNVVYLNFNQHYREIRINAFNQSGQRQLTWSFAEQDSVELNIEQLPSGIYILEIHTDKKVSHSKVIKR